MDISGAIIQSTTGYQRLAGPKHHDSHQETSSESVVVTVQPGTYLPSDAGIVGHHQVLNGQGRAMAVAVALAMCLSIQS